MVPSCAHRGLILAGCGCCCCCCCFQGLCPTAAFHSEHIASNLSCPSCVDECIIHLECLQGLLVPKTLTYINTEGSTSAFRVFSHFINGLADPSPNGSVRIRPSDAWNPQNLDASNSRSAIFWYPPNLATSARHYSGWHQVVLFKKHQ